MSRVLPILFNIEMVRATLDGRKTATRRLIKNPPHPDMPDNHNYCRMPVFVKEYLRTLHYMDVIEQNHFRQTRYFESLAPYDKGDILYVRESWSFLPCVECMDEGPSCNRNPVAYDDGDCESEGCFVYKASHPRPERVRWTPSIHMPKEAARIWLKVTDVRVERLQDMNGQDILREGVNCHVHPEADYFDGNQKMMFAELWDSTIRKPELKRYGWDANPWVWAIEFERCEKPEEQACGEN